MFLAPIGAQVMLTFVRAFVRSGQICLKVNLHLSRSEDSDSLTIFQRAFRENSVYSI